jgi:hypothetical protein
MEWWNTGILEENNLGRDERLLVLGTQARLRGYVYGGQARAPDYPIDSGNGGTPLPPCEDGLTD